MILNLVLLSLTLAHADVDAREERIRARACEIQRRENQPPTFCYSISEKIETDLDSLCTKLSLKAQRLPKFDRYTSKRCREAIERRAKDLVYVEHGDASR